MQCTLRSEGTAEAPVILTSWRVDSVGGDTNIDCPATTPVKGDWSTLYATGIGTIHLTHTQVRYGGRYGNSAESLVELSGNSQAIINNSLLNESAGYGLQMTPSGANLVTQLTMNNTIIEKATYEGVYATANNNATNLVTIANSTIRNNGRNGVQLNTVTNGMISNSAIYGNTNL